MWNSRLNPLTSVLATVIALNPIPALSQSTIPSPTPSTSTIPWSTKVDLFRSFLLQQPDQIAHKGFCTGPVLQKTFADTSCLQIILCNYNCFNEIPYKMRGVAAWFDSLDLRSNADPIWDAYRYYQYGYYADPDDGWRFYDQARLTFGACGNRGPQSSCGPLYCVDAKGATVGTVCGDGTNLESCVPKGQTPWLDPNDRDRLCPWLRGNGTGSGVM
jgi:hypothetical protein